jgi:hypothetical protein
MSPDLDRLGGERDFACWFRHSPNMRSISEDCHRSERSLTPKRHGRASKGRLAGVKSCDIRFLRIV